MKIATCLLFLSTCWGVFSAATAAEVAEEPTPAAKTGLQDELGRTALHRAAQSGDERQMEALLGGGADVEARDAYGQTPLLLAARRGHARAVEMLLKHGADVKTAALNRYTPLHMAAWSGNAKIIKWLLEKGADVNAYDYGNRTPLHYASTKQAVEALLAGGAEVNARYVPWSRTPLLDAAMHGFPEAVKALLDHGANIRATDASHFTSLHWAAWAGHMDVVRILLKHGADVHYEDDSGYTAIYWAELWGHKAITDLLKKKMADTPRPVYRKQEGMDSWG
jgi:ankyrin repeat protein